MKNIKYIILIILVLVAILGVAIVVNKKDDAKIEKKIEEKTKIEIMVFDVSDRSEKTLSKTEIKEGDTIKSGEYYGNDINILEIKEETVKISRTATKYKILEEPTEDSPYPKTEEYIEEVIEEIKYGEKINADINERDPAGPDYAQQRYYYSVRFIKE